MREGLQALRGGEKVSHNHSALNDHEDATTHEDRKTSTSSDTVYCETLTYGGAHNTHHGSGEHSQIKFGKPSPSLSQVAGGNTNMIEGLPNGKLSPLLGAVAPT